MWPALIHTVDLLRFPPCHTVWAQPWSLRIKPQMFTNSLCGRHSAKPSGSLRKSPTNVGREKAKPRKRLSSIQWSSSSERRTSTKSCPQAEHDLLSASSPSKKPLLPTGEIGDGPWGTPAPFVVASIAYDTLCGAQSPFQKCRIR